MKIWYICTVEYYSAIKSENMVFAGRLMELAKENYTKLTQAQKEKYRMHSFICRF